MSAFISWMDDLMKTNGSSQSGDSKPNPQALLSSRANDRSVVSGVIFFGECLLLLLLFAPCRRRDAFEFEA